MARRRPCNRLCWQGVIGGPSNSSRQKLEALLSDFRWVTNPHHLEALLLQRPCRADLAPAIREGTTLVKTVVLAGPLGTISSPAIKSPIFGPKPAPNPPHSLFLDARGQLSCSIPDGSTGTDGAATVEWSTGTRITS